MKSDYNERYQAYLKTNPPKIELRNNLGYFAFIADMKEKFNGGQRITNQQAFTDFIKKEVTL